jgi:hypothetical protein
LLLLSLFDAGAPTLLTRHCFSFLLVWCSPFFLFVQCYCSLIPCSPRYSSVLAQCYYSSFLGRCYDSCVLYLTLLFLCSWLVPNVACSHLGTSLLRHDLVDVMILLLLCSLFFAYAPLVSNWYFPL